MNATTLLSLAGTKKMKNKKNPTMYPEISAALPNMPNMCNSHREKTSWRKKKKVNCPWMWKYFCCCSTKKPCNSSARLTTAIRCSQPYLTCFQASLRALCPIFTVYCRVRCSHFFMHFALLLFLRVNYVIVELTGVVGKELLVTAESVAVYPP